MATTSRAELEALRQKVQEVLRDITALIAADTAEQVAADKGAAPRARQARIS